MSARRVRVTLEGTAHEVSGRCGLLRVQLAPHADGAAASLLVNPEWPDVSVEEVQPPREWRAGDVVLDPADGEVMVRDENGTWTGNLGSDLGDRFVESSVLRTDPYVWHVLRYQAGGDA